MDAIQPYDCSILIHPVSSSVLGPVSRDNFDKCSIRSSFDDFGCVVLFLHSYIMHPPAPTVNNKSVTECNSGCSLQQWCYNRHIEHRGMDGICAYGPNVTDVTVVDIRTNSCYTVESGAIGGDRELHWFPVSVSPSNTEVIHRNRKSPPYSPHRPLSLPQSES